MRILIVSATAFEIAPFVATLEPMVSDGPRLARFRSAGREVDVLTAGIGMVPTAAWCAQAFATAAYDWALNLGVCGSFDPAFAPGCVVHVTADCLAELGAEDGEAFLTPRDLDLPIERDCVSIQPPPNRTLGRLPTVRGITVSTVHGRDASIEAARQRFSPQVESMEGAAFLYACAMSGVPSAQVRAVSNVVARRDRSSWKMAEAIANLSKTAQEILADV